MDVETLKMLGEILKQAESYRPLVDGVKKTIESFGPDLKEIIKSYSLAMINIKADCVDVLVERGYTKEEAIIMVSDQWHEISKQLNKDKKT